MIDQLRQSFQTNGATHPQTMCFVTQYISRIMNVAPKQKDFRNHNKFHDAQLIADDRQLCLMVIEAYICDPKYIRIYENLDQYDDEQWIHMKPSEQDPHGTFYVEELRGWIWDFGPDDPHDTEDILSDNEDLEEWMDFDTLVHQRISYVLLKLTFHAFMGSAEQPAFFEMLWRIIARAFQKQTVFGEGTWSLEGIMEELVHYKAFTFMSNVLLHFRTNKLFPYNSWMRFAGMLIRGQFEALSKMGYHSKISANVLIRNELERVANEENWPALKKKYLLARVGLL